MNEQIHTESDTTGQTLQSPAPFPIYVVLSGLFIVGAIVFAGKGWYTLYDDSDSARVVGGDAYNFIIYATRGTALVCLGIICSVLSVTFALFATMRSKQ